MFYHNNSFVFIRDPFYYLFYSANWNGVHYHVGVARSRNVKGPFKKFGKSILHVDEKKYAEGRNTTFIGPGINLNL